MRLAYLPANQAWVFLFGNDIATATITDMGGTRFFSSRFKAMQAATECGLCVCINNEVITEKEEAENHANLIRFVQEERARA